MIISHLDPNYNPPCENGAHIYSQLICKFFIHNVETDRNWITINVNKCLDHSIVFIHSNLNTKKKYAYLKNYKDLLLVCSQISTCKAVEELGHPLYLPLSIDTNYVHKFYTNIKDRHVCYAGRRDKVDYESFRKNGIDMLCDMPHDELLARMAQYQYVYAVGLTALEAKCLGCNVLPYDQRFPDPRVWVVKDCMQMVPELQRLIDKFK